jgi:hypothetical protein
MLPRKSSRGVEFHRSFVFAKLGPREKRQAQIDSGGIERINRLGQLDTEVVVQVESAGPRNQHLCEVGVNAPIAYRVGVGQRVARNAAPNAHVIELV